MPGPLILLLTVSASVLVNLALARFGQELGWCDRPGRAKIHAHPVPLTGGIGIFLTWTGIGLVTPRSVFHNLPDALTLLIPGLASLILGTWDDLRWKNRSIPLQKFACQTGVGLLTALVVGIATENFQPLHMLLACFFVVLSLNTFNLADGIDGLAAGEALISLLGIFVAFAALGKTALAVSTLLLIATLPGFLILNLQKPSRLFLGDGGTHLLGTLTALLALLVLPEIKPADIWTFIALLLILGLPLIDLIWVTGRRFYLGLPLFAPDRNHLYDILSRFLGTRRTLLFSWLFHSLFVGTGTTLILLEVK